jgi:hypothetical protein
VSEEEVLSRLVFYYTVPPKDEGQVEPQLKKFPLESVSLDEVIPGVALGLPEKFKTTADSSLIDAEQFVIDLNFGLNLNEIDELRDVFQSEISYSVERDDIFITNKINKRYHEYTEPPPYQI